jgi:hypothetical protein
MATVLYAALLSDDAIKVYTRDGPKLTHRATFTCAGGPMWLACNPSKTVMYACTLNSSELVRCGGHCSAALHLSPSPSPLSLSSTATAPVRHIAQIRSDGNAIPLPRIAVINGQRIVVVGAVRDAHTTVRILIMKIAAPCEYACSSRQSTEMNDTHPTASHPTPLWPNSLAASKSIQSLAICTRSGG